MGERDARARVDTVLSRSPEGFPRIKVGFKGITTDEETIDIAVAMVR